jgi:hypothetical protein
MEHSMKKSSKTAPRTGQARKKTRPKPRTFRDLLRDQRGSVMTEAVIMLPFFVIVWGCVIYVQQLYTKGIQTQAVARECAWRHAKDNCEGDTRCSIESGLDPSRDYGSGDSAAIDGAEGTSDLGFLGDGFLTNILFGPDITASATGSTRKPEVIGGGDANLTGRMGLACNEKPRGDLQEVVSTLWSKLWGR